MSDAIADAGIPFDGVFLSSCSTNSDVSMVENGHNHPSLEDHLLNVEQTVRANEDEIVVLKSALADALRRLCAVEAELQQSKGNQAKKKKNSVPVGDATSPTRSPTHTATPNRKVKSLGNLHDDKPKSAKNATRTISAGYQPPKIRRISRGTQSDNEVMIPYSIPENNKNKPPSSAYKKRFWTSTSVDESKIKGKSVDIEAYKEVDKETKENGKPKIILAKKSYKRSMSLNEESSQKGLRDDSVKFNTKGRAMTLYPPSEYQEDQADGSAPEQKLKLGWVYGYRGKDCRDNLHYVESGELVYNMAGVITVHDVKTNTQRHYTQHNDDVKCVAVHPNKKIIASGQVAGHGEDKRPHVRVWDATTLETLSSFGHGAFERGLCAVEFSGNEAGKYLVAFDEGNDHVIYVYDWEKGIKLTETKVSKELLFGVKWNPKSELSFASYGKSHLVFWSLCIEQKGIAPDQKYVHLTKKAAIYDKINKPKYVHTIVHMSNGDLVSGDSNGNIVLFKDENSRNKVSASALSAHKGGVFCLSFIATEEATFILSCGKDGQLSMWNGDLEKIADFSKIPEQYGPARIMIHNDVDGSFVIGTAKNCILQYDSELSTESVLVLGHHDEMWGVAAHSAKPLFASCAHEQLVCVWDGESKTNTWNYYLEEQAQCAEFHPVEHYLLVGTRSGTVYFLNYTTKEEEITIEVARDIITDIKVSPNGEKFAVACRDKNIYLFAWPDDVSAIKKPKILQAHTSKVMHIDWSLDSEYLQSNSSDYELLYWSAVAALQILSPSELRDVNWATWTCPYGFPSMGIWPEGEGDINACSRSNDGKLIATADTSGFVKVFRYPCTRLRSENRVGVGHSSHVTCVRFLANDNGVVSVGGNDSSIMQWILE